MSVVHQQVYKELRDGGMLNTTLCGRLAAGEDMNVAGIDESTGTSETVTCKLCLKRLKQKEQP